MGSPLYEFKAKRKPVVPAEEDPSRGARKSKKSTSTGEEKDYTGAKSVFEQRILDAKIAEETEKKFQEKRRNIKAAAEARKRKKKTRRMAQREFSNRRDSPVMVRLLQQIIDAQDD